MGDVRLELRLRGAGDEDLPNLPEVPNEAVRELLTWLGERFGLSGPGVEELQAQLRGARAELAHIQRARDNNAKALAELLRIQYGLPFPRVLLFLEHFVPSLEQAALPPDMAAELLHLVWSSEIPEKIRHVLERIASAPSSPPRPEDPGTDRALTIIRSHLDALPPGDPRRAVLADVATEILLPTETQP